MVRRGRSASPPPAPRRAAPSRPSNVPARAPAPQTAPATMQAAHQQPSMFQQMAATAGGVAVGSAVGHVAGGALTGMFSGGSKDEVTPTQHGQPAQAYGQAYAQPGEEPKGPCAWEISQFLQCAQGQSDLTLCEGFNEALRQCKVANHV